MKHKKDPNRVSLSTIYGKITAYYRIGMMEEARQWAAKMVEELEHLELLPINKK